MSLLVTPERSLTRARVFAAAAPDRSAAGRELLREPSAGRRSPRSVRHQQRRYRSGAAEGVLLDHRAPARVARRVERCRRSSSTTTRRASGRRARSGFSSSSAIPNTRVLDGGFNAWIETRAAGHAAGARSRSRPTGPARATRRFLPAGATCSDRLGSPDAVILDTRSDGEYCGTTVRAARGGAVPGAVHLEWTNNLAPDGAFKTRRRAEGRCTSAQA